MKMGLIILLGLSMAFSASAQTPDGLGIVLERREMRRVERAAPSLETGTPLMLMKPEARERVDALLADRETLAAAKELARKVRANKPDAVGDLPDAKILEVADEVLNTSGRDSAATGIIGAAIGAAAAAIGRKWKGKQQ